MWRMKLGWNVAAGLAFSLSYLCRTKYVTYCEYWRRNRLLGANISFTRYSTAHFIHNFFIITENRRLISCIGLLRSICAILYCVFKAHFFLQSQFLLQRENIFNFSNSFFGLILYFTDDTVSVNPCLKHSSLNVALLVAVVTACDSIIYTKCIVYSNNFSEFSYGNPRINWMALSISMGWERRQCQPDCDVEVTKWTIF